MHWEWIVVDGEFLEGSTIRVSVKLETMGLTLFLEIVCMLILRDKEIVAESTSARIDELLRNVVKYLVLFRKLLQLLVKFEELERLDLIFYAILIRFHS